MWSTATADVARILALLLPLKIIILASHPGVPAYLPFIPPAHKNAGIALLTLGALLFYTFTVYLNHTAERASGRAVTALARRLYPSGLDAGRLFQLQKTFVDLCKIAAALLFILLAGALLFLANPSLLLFLPLAALLALGVTALLLKDRGTGRSPLQVWIVSKHREYVNVIATVVFFGGFLVILVPYVRGAESNVIIGVLSILVARQVIMSMDHIARDVISLRSRQEVIDRLVFSSQEPLDNSQKIWVTRIFDAFPRGRVLELAAQYLGQTASAPGAIESIWTDSPSPGIYALDILVGPRGERRPNRFRVYIYTPAQAKRADHQSQLFDLVAPGAICAPSIIASFEVDQFRCLICGAGDGIPPDAKNWANLRSSLLERIWSYVPPSACADCSPSSQALLPSRVSADFIQPLRLAATNSREMSYVDALSANLEFINEQLDSQPLVLHNPDLARLAVATDGPSHLVMLWGRWSLQPLGAAIFISGLMEGAPARLESLKKLRPDLAHRRWMGDLQLSALCIKLGLHIQLGEFRSGVTTLPGIMNFLDTTLRNSSEHAHLRA
ncbi:MAG: hypothetical protein LJE69_12075 [Thiohalocapsa sp.]|nr:hypothetical protein [Thiohalocapsa sp.]